MKYYCVSWVAYQIFLCNELDLKEKHRKELKGFPCIVRICFPTPRCEACEIYSSVPLSKCKFHYIGRATRR